MRVTLPARTGWILGLWVVVASATAALASLAAGPTGRLPILAGISATRAGMTLAGVACVGLALVGALLPHADTEADGVRRRADRMILAAAGVWAVLVLLGIAFRAADAFGRPVIQLGGGQLLRWTTELAAGRGMVLAAGCALVVLGCVVVRLRNPRRISVRTLLVVALLGVLVPAATGHAGTAPDHQLAVLAVALHVGAAALWTGGLAALLALVTRGRLLAGAVERFSRLAGVCLVAVALSGLISAQIRLESWTALVTTGYGALVIAKAICIVLLAALGGLARRRLATGRMPVLRWAGWEVALMAVTLGFAAALTQTG